MPDKTINIRVEQEGGLAQAAAGAGGRGGGGGGAGGGGGLLLAAATAGETGGAGVAAGEAAGGGAAAGGAAAGGAAAIAGPLVAILAAVVAISAAVSILVSSSKFLQKTLGRIGKILMMFLQPIAEIVATLLQPLIWIMMPVMKMLRMIFRPLRRALMEQLQERRQEMTAAFKAGDFEGAMDLYMEAIGAALGEWIEGTLIPLMIEMFTPDEEGVSFLDNIINALGLRQEVNLFNTIMSWLGLDEEINFLGTILKALGLGGDEGNGEEDGDGFTPLQTVSETLGEKWTGFLDDIVYPFFGIEETDTTADVLYKVAKKTIITLLSVYTPLKEEDLQKMWDNLESTIEMILSTDYWTGAGEAIGKWVQGVMDAVKGALNWAEEQVRAIFEGVGAGLSAAGKTLFTAGEVMEKGAEKIVNELNINTSVELDGEQIAENIDRRTVENVKEQPK